MSQKEKLELRRYFDDELFQWVTTTPSILHLFDEKQIRNVSARQIRKLMQGKTLRKNPHSCARSLIMLSVRTSPQAYLQTSLIMAILEVKQVLLIRLGVIGRRY